MKKRSILTATLAFFAMVAMASCGPTASPSSSDPTESPSSSNPAADEDMLAVYNAYVENGGTLSYEEWLETIKGEDGRGIVKIEKTSSTGNVDIYTITYSDGTSSYFTVTNGTNGEQGIQGEPGEDGHTPVITIGENGNWFIDGVDTGIAAIGQKGEDGRGIVSIEKTGTEGNVDTYTITYSDGTSSIFTVTNGTNGEQGIQGEPGEDGHTPVITIGDNGNWFIDGADTGIAAQGPHAGETFTVRYHLNGGTLPEGYADVFTVDWGDILDLPVPTYYAHSFEGWFTGEGVNLHRQWYSTDAVFTDIDLYAEWQVIPELILRDISSLTKDDANNRRHVRGVITQIGSGGYPIIDDGTGALRLYGFNVRENFKLGDYVDAFGAVSRSSNTFMLTDCTVEKNDGTAPTPTLENPYVLDPSTVDKIYKNGTNEYAFLKPVTFWGTAFMSGNYQAVHVQDVDTTMLIRPTTWDGEWEVGKVYEITGYLAAYNSGYEYAAIYISELKEHPIDMTSFSIVLEDDADVLYVGIPNKVVAVPTPANANRTDVDWSITYGAENIDFDAATGAITPKAAGSVTIVPSHAPIAGGDAVTSSVTFTIIDPDPVTGITLDQTEITGIHGEKTATLKAAVIGGDLVITDIIWSSSDVSVATVDENGVVSGVNPGTATITATTKGKDTNGNRMSASCQVTVEGYPASSEEAPLDPDVWAKWISEDTSVAKKYDVDTWVKGKVQSASYNAAYDNYNIYLESAEGYTIQIYRAVVAEGATGVVAGDDLTGKVVVAHGTTEMYINSSGQIVEISAGGQITHAEDAPVPENEETLTFSSLGYENVQSLDGVAIAGETFTVTFSKGTGPNAPAYYYTSASARFYGGNTLTIALKDTTKAIASIVFELDSTRTFDANSIVDSGAFDDIGKATITWTPADSATSSLVVTNGNTSGNIRIVSITVKLVS